MHRFVLLYLWLDDTLQSGTLAWLLLWSLLALLAGCALAVWPGT